MNKKRLLTLVLSFLILAGCSNKTDDSLSKNEETPSNVETSSSTESSKEEITSQEKETSSEETIEKTYHKFFDVDDELFMLPGEDYYLNMMAFNDTDINELSYNLESNDYATISNDGIIHAITNDDESKASVKLTIENDIMYQNITISVVDYETYGSYKTSVDLGRLYNKKVMFFGDSITHNWAKYPSGNRPTTPADIEAANNVTSLGYNYVPLLNDKCQFASLTNAAWSGGTMAYDPNSTERFVYKSFVGAIEDNVDAIKEADYFFVFYGTNDLSERYTIDDRIEMTSLDNKRHSIISSMTYGVNRIREINEDAIIIFINVLYRTYGDANIDDKVCELNEAYTGKMVEYRTKLLNVYEIFDHSNFTLKYSKDGLHPNEQGYKLIAEYILNGQRKGLLNYEN